MNLLKKSLLVVSLIFSLKNQLFSEEVVISDESTALSKTDGQEAEKEQIQQSNPEIEQGRSFKIKLLGAIAGIIVVLLTVKKSYESRKMSTQPNVQPELFDAGHGENLPAGNDSPGENVIDDLANASSQAGHIGGDVSPSYPIFPKGPGMSSMLGGKSPLSGASGGAGGIFAFNAARMATSPKSEP